MRQVNPYRFGAVTTDIIGIDAIQSVRVPAGTAFASINFSDYYRNEVLALLYNGSIVTVPIVWSSSGYSTSAGTYVLSGNFSLPGGVTNGNGVVPQISVQVVTLESEVQAVLTQAGVDGVNVFTPINTGDINAMIAGEKSDGTFATKDVYYVTMNDGSSGISLYNYKNPAANKLVINGGVTWTSRKGFSGNLTNAYLDTQYNPSTATNFTQNSCGIGVYSYSDAATMTLFGCVATGARIALSNAARTTFFEITGNTNPSFTDELGMGYHHIYRTASGSVNAYKNSAFYAQAVADTSVARPNTNIYLLARNNNGVAADQFGDATISHFWAGAPLSSATSSMFNRWQTYLLSCRVRNVYSSPSTVGVKINDDFARASLGTNYIVSFGTWATDGVKLTCSGGANDFLKKCAFKYGQSSENCLIEEQIVCASAPAANAGHGFGFADYAGPNGERSIIAKIDLSNGANAGKCQIFTFDGTTGVQVAISSTAIPTVALNDVFNMSITKSIVAGLVSYTLTVTRVSDSSSVNCTYANLLGDSTGDIAMYTFGGTQNVRLLKATFNDATKSKVTFVGNSLTHGAFATSLSLRFASNIVPSYQVSAGSGDTTGDVVGASAAIPGKMRNLTDMYSPYYAAIIGGNDIAGGIATATWQNNLRKFVFTLENEGHKMILVNPGARDDGDVSVVSTFYASAFPGRIATNAGYLAVKGAGTGLNAAMGSGDGVHFNNLGHSTFASSTAGSLPVLYYGAA